MSSCCVRNKYLRHYCKLRPIKSSTFLLQVHQSHLFPHHRRSREPQIIIAHQHVPTHTETLATCDQTARLNWYLGLFGVMFSIKTTFWPPYPLHFRDCNFAAKRMSRMYLFLSPRLHLVFPPRHNDARILLPKPMTQDSSS